MYLFHRLLTSPVVVAVFKQALMEGIGGTKRRGLKVKFNFYGIFYIQILEKLNVMLTCRLCSK